MRAHFPDLTFFIDAGGRYSHSKEVPIVFAGLAIESRSVNEIRDSLLAAANGLLCKWSNGKETKACAAVIFRLLSKRQLTGIVRIVWKNAPEWDQYFDEGQRLYEKGIQKAQEPMPYAKPMATFKLQQFGILCGDLTGFFASRHSDRLPPKHSVIQPVDVTAVFDSDIQGEANHRVWKNVFAHTHGELKGTQERLRIGPRIKAEIKTEQEEPLLLLADYLAGYHYSRVAYEAQQESNWTDLLAAVRPMVTKIPTGSHKIIEGPFKERYFLSSDTFDRILPKQERDRITTPPQ